MVYPPFPQVKYSCCYLIILLFHVIPVSSNRTVRTQFLIWILHLRDHQSPPPVRVTLFPFACCCCQTTHSNTSSAIRLPICRTTYCILPPPRGRLSRYHPLLLLVSSIPWSLFWFQTPFGWSIGPSLEKDSEVVWTVVDSLLGGQLPPIPLIYSSLHWLMDRGGQRSTFCYGSILTWKQINSFFFQFLASGGQNEVVILIPHMSVLGRTVNSWRRMSIMWLGSSWQRRLKYSRWLNDWSAHIWPCQNRVSMTRLRRKS